MANFTKIIGIALGLAVVALVIPFAVALIADAGNYVVNATAGTTLSDVADPAIITILTVLLPVMAIISIVLYFVPKMRGE